MTMENCSYESDILAALSRDRWTQSHRHHLAGCPHCRETVRLAEGLIAMTSLDDRITLPSAEMMVLKARLRTKRQSEAKLVGVIYVIQSAAATIGVLIALAMFVPAVNEFVARLVPLPRSLGEASIPLLIMLAPIAVLFIVVQLTDWGWQPTRSKSNIKTTATLCV